MPSPTGRRQCKPGAKQLGGGTVTLLNRVGVHAEGDRRISVPEPTGNCPHVHTGTDQFCRR